MAELGFRVLVIDLDPQGNASTGLGIEVGQRMRTSYDLLLEEIAVEDLALQSSVENVLIVPSNADLASADIDLVANEKRSFLLHDALRGVGVQALHLDYVLIDCPPSLSLLTVNALIAATSTLIPLQSEFFALEGLSQLMLTIRDIVVVTMTDARNKLSQQVEADVRATLGSVVFETVIPRNVRVSEAPSYAMPVLSYDPSSKGAEAYRRLVREIAVNNGEVLAG